MKALLTLYVFWPILCLAGMFMHMTFGYDSWAKPLGEGGAQGLAAWLSVSLVAVAGVGCAVYIWGWKP